VKKEVVLMRHQNGTPTNRRRLVAISTMLAVVLVGVLAATVVGPRRAIDWLGNYLIPVGVITGLVIASLALLVWVVKRLPESPLRDWWQ
jgi:protein-S-isoprenylcysteine O-methyltransferase Ste14